MDPAAALMSTMHSKSQNDSYLSGAASVAGFEDVAKQPTTSSVKHRLGWIV